MRPGDPLSFVIGFACVFMAIVELCTGRYFDRKAAAADAAKGGGGGGGGKYADNWPAGGSQPDPPSGFTPRLPEGWKPAQDAAGNTYYYNEATGGSSWNVPAG